MKSILSSVLALTVISMVCCACGSAPTAADNNPNKAAVDPSKAESGANKKVGGGMAPPMIPAPPGVKTGPAK